MSPNIIFIILLVLSYVGVVFVYKRKKNSLLGGMEFLLIGYGFSSVSYDDSMLKPLLYAFLGWIGLLAGLQIKIQYFSQISISFYRAVLSYCTCVYVFTMSIVLIFYDFYDAAIFSVCLLPVSYLIAARSSRGNRYLLFFVSIVPIISIALYFVITLFFSYRSHTLLLLLCIPVFSIIVRFILSLLEDHRSLPFMLTGLIIFISLCCAALELSPMIVCFFTGMYIANFSSLDVAVFKVLYNDEKPLYCLFLMLVGMLGGFLPKPVLLLNGCIIISFSCALKFILARIPFLNLEPDSWRAMIAPGSIGIAIGTDVWLLQGGMIATEWFTLLLVVVILLQFISIVLSGRYEKKATS